MSQRELQTYWKIGRIENLENIFLNEHLSDLIGRISGWAERLK